MISFVATPDKFMNDEYCNKVTDDVSLLKIGVIYGANASGKSNVLKALSFFKQLMQRVPQDRNESMKLVPFLLDQQSRNEHCRMGMDFYLKQPKELNEVCPRLLVRSGDLFILLRRRE